MKLNKSIVLLSVVASLFGSVSAADKYYETLKEKIIPTQRIELNFSGLNDDEDKVAVIRNNLSKLINYKEIATTENYKKAKVVLIDPILAACNGLLPTDKDKKLNIFFNYKNELCVAQTTSESDNGTKVDLTTLDAIMAEQEENAANHNVPSFVPQTIVNNERDKFDTTYVFKNIPELDKRTGMKRLLLLRDAFTTVGREYAKTGDIDNVLQSYIVIGSLYNGKVNLKEALQKTIEYANLYLSDINSRINSSNLSKQNTKDLAEKAKFEKWLSDAKEGNVQIVPPFDDRLDSKVSEIVSEQLNTRTFFRGYKIAANQEVAKEIISLNGVRYIITLDKQVGSLSPEEKEPVLYESNRK
ncbi:MAG: hypothetical protein WC755_00385 [Candidatus Woesearchaeota archaeon]|jgi:hypothetical protein